MSDYIDQLEKAKMRATDRVLILKPVAGKNTLATTGLIDNRVFTGENKLHAIMDSQSTLWYLKYDHGIVPEPLKQRFTSFPKLKTFVEGYFKRRNIDIVEVID